MEIMYQWNIIAFILLDWLFFSCVICYIEIEFPEKCTFKLQGRTMNDEIRRSRKEKGMILFYSSVSSSLLTAITLTIFNFIAVSTNFIIDISAGVIAVGGLGILLMPNFKEKDTLWDWMQMNPVAKRLLEAKRISLYKQTGSLLLLFASLIQLLRVLQIAQSS